MSKYLLLALALLIGITPAAHAQQRRREEPRPFVIDDTTSFDMRSRAGQNYRIWVSWPQGQMPAGGWPVLYLLDGDVYFPIATLIAQNLAGNPDNSGVEEGIIVGIGYPDESRRDIDYTPATPPTPAGANPYLYPAYETGGAEAFLNFIEQELKPRIERDWRIDRNQQTLSGHAFGGLFTLYAFFTRPQSFNTYVASSPSIWFRGRHILETERAFLARTDRPADRRLFITGAEYAQSLPQHQVLEPSWDPRLMDNGQRRMVDNAREMVWRLRHAGVNADWRLFDRENQMSVAFPALSHVVSEAFRTPATVPTRPFVPATSGS